MGSVGDSFCLSCIHLYIFQWFSWLIYSGNNWNSSAAQSDLTSSGKLTLACSHENWAEFQESKWRHARSLLRSKFRIGTLTFITFYWLKQVLSTAQIQERGNRFHLLMRELQSHVAKGKNIKLRTFATSLQYDR